MSYRIFYWCVSHIGKIRKENQDNLLCDNHFLEASKSEAQFQLNGNTKPSPRTIFGVFDGMGGEAYGEVASYIAAKIASEIEIHNDPPTSFLSFCEKANAEICSYEQAHNISSMGTTAAILSFTKKQITLCNIGDSKVFLFRDGTLTQISRDHVIASRSGLKAPLFQNLGIAPTELIIDPYVAQGAYHDGDFYLICSDGLTDMVTPQEIAEILKTAKIDQSANALLHKALTRGGRDNITFILCKIKRCLGWF